MKSENNDSWDENKLFVKSSLERIESALQKVDDKVDNLNLFKAKIIGVAAGVSGIVSLIISLTMLLVTHSVAK